MKALLIFVYLILQTICLASKSDLEAVQDDELMELIRNEKYVVVLFSRKYCEKCEEFENELINLREDLVETLNCWVVKAVDSQMVRLYSPNKEPVLVFFRHGVPLLYDGPVNDEHIMHVFANNKEPVVKELDDNTFEHLTQAATGATTGDWFVLFYTPECVDCQRLQARWEAVGAHLKSRMNVARVNKAGQGAKTARRFEVYQVPAFILFRRGKMYRYRIQNYEVSALVSFAQDWYKNVQAEPVPVPKSPFDDLIAMIVAYFKENPWVLPVFGCTFVGGLLAAVILKFTSKKPSEKSEKKTKSEKKVTKKEK